MVRAADAKEVGVENSAEETYHNPDLQQTITPNSQVNAAEVLSYVKNSLKPTSALLSAKRIGRYLPGYDASRRAGMTFRVVRRSKDRAARAILWLFRLEPCRGSGTAG